MNDPIRQCPAWAPSAVLHWLVAVLMASVAVLPWPVPAVAQAGSDAVTLQTFFGEYAGRTLFPMGEAGNRDLRVVIGPYNIHGLTVTWETAILKGDEGASRKATSVNFAPTSRPGVYAAVYADGSQPDLAAGESYSWARLAGRTLSVTVFTIADNGDYVIQQYDRTLSDAGLMLEFQRVRNGVVERQIKGTLERIKAANGPDAGSAPAAQ